MTAIFGGGGVLSANSTPAFKFQEFTVADGQTLFTLSNFSYVLGTQSLWVFINGQKAVVGVDYNETTTGSFTWTYPLTALDTIEAIGVALASITANVASATAAAQASATAAAASATAASNSATAAASSATTASTAAGAASTSASSAGTSATAASSSASSAASSASAANSSATAASGSATTATAQAANASTSASNAASSATSASTSATTATTQATTATTAASTATTQAGNASTSATNAASSATAAASSAASAAAAAASGLYRQVLDKSANYTILPADAGTLFRANTGSGSVTFTLPQISTVTDGFRVSVVKWTSDGSQAVINRSGSDTINGTTSVSISAQYSQVIFVADFETNTWFASQSGLGATSANVDTFTGNGTTSPFTLSVDPGNKNNTDVFFGGVHQDHSTYSISGTALTFTTATPTGVSIEVKYSTPLPIGVPSDGTVSTVKLQDKNVTYAKIQDVTAGKVLGHDSSGNGTVQELPISVDTSGNVSFKMPDGNVQTFAVNWTSESTDFNNAIRPGFYRIPAVSTNAPITNANGDLLVIANGDTLIQLFFDVYNNQSVWWRSRNSSAIWGSWYSHSSVGGGGQTWQDVTASRAMTTTYTNSTGKPIQVMVCMAYGSVGNFTTNLLVGGNQAQVLNIGVVTGGGGIFPMTAIVPAGATYQVTGSSGINKWYELRN